MSDITIVTAFFDIGRGNIQRENAPSYTTRTTDTYFEYFSNLAQLENDMVIFTSQEYVEKIKELRQGKPTQVVVFDFHDKLHYFRKKIAYIQQDEKFTSRICSDLVDNIEYWSANYVLITNLKTYFVNKAIKEKLIRTNLVSWIDFGYIRSIDTLNHVKKWKYNFDQEYIHFFTIRKRFKVKKYQEVLNLIFNNQVFIIGGGDCKFIKSMEGIYVFIVPKSKGIIKKRYCR